MALERKGATTLKTDSNIKPMDEVGRKLNACAWCNFSNDDDTKAPVHAKCASVVVNRGHKYQCETCGKFWEAKDLNKPWTEELERGTAWVRETQARRLREA